MLQEDIHPTYMVKTMSKLILNEVILDFMQATFFYSEHFLNHSRHLVHIIYIIVLKILGKVVLNYFSDFKSKSCKQLLLNFITLYQ